MRDPRITAIIILDFMLIFMTAFWILSTLTKSIGFAELLYDIVYVVTNIATLVLNISLLQSRQ